MAKTFLNDAPPQPDIPPLPSGAYRLLTIDDLLHQPALEFLIENFISQRNFVVLYGAPGVSKSFVALHIALCVASGMECFGRKVKRGPIVYVTAEGEEGYKQRVEAWLVTHPKASIRPHHALFLPDSVNLLKEEAVDTLLDQLAQLRDSPTLIIFDTLARCMVGGDENSTRDFGLVVDAADRLRKELGCTALVVHHSGKKGLIERGSSSIRGSSDTMMSLRAMKSGGMKLINTKQKNAAPFLPLSLTREEVELGELEDSCIIRYVPGLDLMPSTQKILLALRALPLGATFTDLEKTLLKKALRAALKEAISAGLAKKPREKRMGKYTLTPAGALVADSLSKPLLKEPKGLLPPTLESGE